MTFALLAGYDWAILSLAALGAVSLGSLAGSVLALWEGEE